jgi:hypothetical protein
VINWKVSRILNFNSLSLVLLMKVGLILYFSFVYFRIRA